jgi:hypothetical protein
MSITVDPAKKYVKVVHEGDGQTFEFTAMQMLEKKVWAHRS